MNLEAVTIIGALIIFCPLFFLIGLLAGKIIYRDRQYHTVNEFQKRASKVGAVPEFIAPGEKAEVIEVMDIQHCNPLSNDKCHGCRYAGRYVFDRR